MLYKIISIDDEDLHFLLQLDFKCDVVLDTEPVLPEMVSSFKLLFKIPGFEYTTVSDWHRYSMLA